LVLKLIDRFPFIIYGGGALLGYVAGEMLVGEALFKPLLEAQHALHWLVPAAGAVFVLGMGRWLAMRKAQVVGAVDLVDETVLAGTGDQSAVSQKASAAANEK
jgi:predicted tellurium resistance membrane protein TerC